MRASHCSELDANGFLLRMKRDLLSVGLQYTCSTEDGFTATISLQKCHKHVIKPLIRRRFEKYYDTYWSRRCSQRDRRMGKLVVTVGLVRASHVYFVRI